VKKFYLEQTKIIADITFNIVLYKLTISYRIV